MFTLSDILVIAFLGLELAFCLYCLWTWPITF